MKTVKCKSGLKGWQCKLRKNYDNSFEQFEAYNETYNIAERLGFKTALEAWDKNPLIQGSTEPSDLRIVISKLTEFKKEYRQICVDTWGDAMEAWFECVGRMYKRHLDIPSKYQYKAGILSPCEKESNFYYFFKDCNKKELTQIAEFLYRYCSYLKYKKVDY